MTVAKEWQAISPPLREPYSAPHRPCCEPSASEPQPRQRRDVKLKAPLSGPPPWPRSPGRYTGALTAAGHSTSWERIPIPTPQTAARPCPSVPPLRHPWSLLLSIIVATFPHVRTPQIGRSKVPLMSSAILDPSIAALADELSVYSCILLRVQPGARNSNMAGMAKSHPPPPPGVLTPSHVGRRPLTCIPPAYCSCARDLPGARGPASQSSTANHSFHVRSAAPISLSGLCSGRRNGTLSNGSMSYSRLTAAHPPLSAEKR